MAFDEKSLQGRYDLVNLSVSSSTQISSRTSAVSRHLESNGNDGSKTTIVVLTAASKAANKLISIAEIAKRDLASNGVNVFQYTALSSKMVEIPRDDGKKQNGEDSDDAYQIMGEEKDNGMKKRNVPVMTVYLSKVPIRELKTAFGEQT